MKLIHLVSRWRRGEVCNRLDMIVSYSLNFFFFFGYVIVNRPRASFWF